MDSTGKQNEAKGHEIEAARQQPCMGYHKIHCTEYPGEGAEYEWADDGKWYRPHKIPALSRSCGLDGSVDRLEHPGLDARQGQKIFLFLSQTSTQLWSPPILLFNVYGGGELFLLRANRSGCETDHLSHIHLCAA